MAHAANSPPRARAKPQIEIDHALAAGSTRTLADDARAGLTRQLKELPPKHLYDSRGAELFDRICELPEYYPTRTERAILERVAPELIELTGAAELVELGAGSAVKTRLLLDAMAGAGTLRRFVAVDVTESVVRKVAAELIEEYEGLIVRGLIADFERQLERLPSSEEPRMLALLGGTIGNLEPSSRRRFLRSVANLLGPLDHLLLGTDLVKDRATLEAAYDDAAGVTAEFNRNMLHVLNRELGANFDPSRFDHVARFDTEHEWIEMRLRARSAQRVVLPAISLTVEFAAGEDLRTEISAKFTRERVAGDLAASGLRLTNWYTDPRGWFALSLARRHSD